MKLEIVPASTGVQWVKLGIKTFFRQPLALAGLFFMFMAALSIISLIPLIGSPLGLALLPVGTLGLMAATQQAGAGKFPMPTLLLTAFRGGDARRRSMLLLGGLFAVSFLLVIAMTAVADGGKLARLYMMGGQISKEVVMAEDFQAALWIGALLYMPLSLMFWHAPALVFWHDVSPVKSLFFSLVACLRNYRAFLVYGLVWGAVFLGAGFLLSLISIASGSTAFMSAALLPTGLLLASMFFTSIYFTYLDSFGIAPGSATLPGEQK